MRVLARRPSKCGLSRQRQPRRLGSGQCPEEGSWPQWLTRVSSHTPLTACFLERCARVVRSFTVYSCFFGFHRLSVVLSVDDLPVSHPSSLLEKHRAYRHRQRSSSSSESDPGGGFSLQERSGVLGRCRRSLCQRCHSKAIRVTIVAGSLGGFKFTCHKWAGKRQLEAGLSSARMGPPGDWSIDSVFLVFNLN